MKPGRVLMAAVAVALVVIPADVSLAGPDARPAASTASPVIVAGWGRNYSGQVGNGLAGGRGGDDWQVYPDRVVGLTGPAVQVAAGGDVSAAVLADGSVWTWGTDPSASDSYRSCGWLGRGVDSDPTPGRVTFPNRADGTPPTIVQVAVSILSRYTLALASDGSVYSWGCDDFGELGTGSAGGVRMSPGLVTLAGVSGVAEVAVGYGFSVILKRNGEIYTWGRNDRGQLGNGTTVDSLTPVRAGPYGFAHIAAGISSVIAVRTPALGGSVFTWGDNAFGQLGRNSTDPFSATPMREAARLEAVTGVATTGTTDLVRRSDGTVWGWGYNGNGSLATPPLSFNDYRSRPSQLTALPDHISQVALTFDNGVAVREDGTVWAWGDNNEGIRGDGTRNGFVIFAPESVGRVHGVVSISGGGWTVLAIAASVDSTVVPNVIGLSCTAAVAAVTAAGLVSSCVPGQVVRGQSPAEGTHVPTGSSVTLTVAAVVPDLVDLNVGQALNRLTSLGLVGVTNGSGGFVASQSPQPGTVVDLGSTVSMGLKPVRG